MKKLKALGSIWLALVGGVLVVTMIASAVSSASMSRSVQASNRSARPVATRPATVPTLASPTSTTATPPAASPPSVSTTTATPRRSSSAVSGLSESTRKLVFFTLVRCQDNGSGNAHDVACMRTAEGAYDITRSQLNRIIDEGIRKRWPPLR